jgi:hypothetical protein
MRVLGRTIANDEKRQGVRIRSFYMIPSYPLWLDALIVIRDGAAGIEIMKNEEAMRKWK